MDRILPFLFPAQQASDEPFMRNADAKIQYSDHAAASSPSSAPGATIQVPHYFYPLQVHIPGYTENTLSVPTMLAAFALAAVAVLSLSYYATLILQKRTRRVLSTADTTAVLWFALSGCIHLMFEGFFSLRHASMGSEMSLFGQLWKEYALSDSRYMTSDTFVLIMESFTAWVLGPLCVVLVGGTMAGSAWRQPLQIVVLVCQVYGVVLYYACAEWDFYHHGIQYGRSEPAYYLGYFWGINGLWVVVPACKLSFPTRPFPTILSYRISIADWISSHQI